MRNKRAILWVAAISISLGLSGATKPADAAALLRTSDYVTIAALTADWPSHVVTLKYKVKKALPANGALELAAHNLHTVLPVLLSVQNGQTKTGVTYAVTFTAPAETPADVVQVEATLLTPIPGKTIKQRNQSLSGFVMLAPATAITGKGTISAGDIKARAKTVDGGSAALLLSSDGAGKLSANAQIYSALTSGIPGNGQTKTSALNCTWAAGNYLEFSLKFQKGKTDPAVDVAIAVNLWTTSDKRKKVCAATSVVNYLS